MPGLDGNAITGGTFLEKRKSIVHRHCLWVRRSPLRLDT